MLGSTREHEGPAVTPAQLLSMTAGFLDPAREYTADAGIWAAAVLALREDFEARYPDLFSGFGFRRQPGARPYSSEVSAFLTYMQVGRSGAVPNPDYEILQLRDKRQAGLLAPYRTRTGYERALQAAEELAQTLMERHLVDAHLST